MRKRVKFCVLCFSIVTGFVLGGCGNSKKEELNGVKTFTIELEGNRTTGYEWDYTPSRIGVVEEVVKDYKTENPDGMSGTGGTFIFGFDGKKKGEVELEFGYRRPWETAEPTKKVVYKLTVDKNKMIQGEVIEK